MLADAEQSWDKLRDAVLAECRPFRGRVDLGVGGICEHLSDFPRSYREAQLALKIQRAIGGDQPITSFDQLGIYSVLAEVEDIAGVERFAHEWLGALLDYDTQRNAELVPTLAAYLAQGGNSANTAAALSVHRNTLKYRLERVSEISGHDLHDSDPVFNLQLAVRVWRMLGALQDDGAVPSVDSA